MTDRLTTGDERDLRQSGYMSPLEERIWATLDAARADLAESKQRAADYEVTLQQVERERDDSRADLATCEQYRLDAAGINEQLIKERDTARRHATHWEQGARDEQKRAETAEATLKLARTYTGLEAKGCPLCIYRDGVFIEACSMHRQIDTARVEAERLHAWLKKIEGGDDPCTDESQLRQWAYEAVTLGATLEVSDER